MRFAVLARDEQVEELAKRVYAFEGAATKAKVREAARALAGANPFLRRRDEVPPGTLVAVPPLAGAQLGAETHEGEQLLSASLVEQLRGAVALSGRLLSEEADAELADARRVGELLTSREVKALGRKRPELSEELADLGDAASSRLESARELQRYQKQAFAQLEQDLDELLTAFGTGA